jgi:hypothetical protein
VSLREVITTVLDTVGVLLLAAGAVAAVFPWIGWAGLAAGGCVVLVASQLSAHSGDRG